MSEQLIDPKIYGAEDLTPRTDPASQAQSYVAPKQVPIVPAATRGSMTPLNEGVDQLSQNNREPATLLESLGAGLTQSSLAVAYRAYNQPVFPPVEGFSPTSMLNQVPFQMDSTQEKFMLDSRSPQEFQHKLDAMDQQRMAYQAMGDHGVANFGLGMVDPGYLAIDMASMGIAKVARLAGAGAMAARGVAGGSAFLGAYALGSVEQLAQPVSQTEVFANAMLNGAATGAFFHEGKIIPKDAEFPGAELTQVATDMRERNTSVQETQAIRAETSDALSGPRDAVRPDAEPVLPVEPAAANGAVPAEPQSVDTPVRDVAGRSVPDVGTEHSAKSILADMADNPDPLVSELSKQVSNLLVDDVRVQRVPASELVDGTRPYYSGPQHTVFIGDDTSQAIQLHEITHALTYHKLEYGLANPASAHGVIVQQMQQLMEQVKAAAPTLLGSDAKYYMSNIHEFVAGVFSGKSEFTDMLSKMPVQGSTQSVLGSVVDKIRRLLGMDPSANNALTHAIGLTEQLASERLNVNLHQGMHIAEVDGGVSAGQGMGIRLAPDPTTIRLSPEVQASIRTTPQAKEALSKRIAKNISWSLNKSLGAFSDEAKRIADLMTDDPLSMHGDSVASQQRAIRADLERAQFAYEDKLSKAMADKGFGTLNQLLHTREALAAQDTIERSVGMEMLRRDRLASDGLPIDKTNVDPAVSSMADALDNVAKVGGDEAKRSGVTGAESIPDKSGFFSRRWDYARMSAIESKLVAGGATEGEARSAMKDAIFAGLQRVNGWDSETTRDVANAIYDRARAKGYFEDSSMRTHAGNDTLSEVRNVLSDSGIRGDRAQRVLDILAGKQDEAGRASFLKPRVDIAMDEHITMPDGSTSTVADMIDMNMANITDRYLDSVSAQSAFARKGITSASDLVAMRKQLLESIGSEGDRATAAKLFDSTVDALFGRPVGEEMPTFMRISGALTQMVGLAKASLFQFTEYATPMAKYGMAKTMASVFKELPFFRAMYNSPKEATHLRNILTANASQDIRIRPFLTRMEDNFEVPVSSAVQLSIMQAKQLVPIVNAFKFVQGHQARTVGNLIVDTFRRGAEGDERALAALAEYGLEPRIMRDIQADITANGLDTKNWKPATWDAVRGPLTKMMDDAVLKNRTGEVPAFAQFTALGKFVFTFRSFVLGSHNKVLANTLNNGGFSGLSLLMLYQFPMTFALTAADSAVLSTSKKKTDSQLIGDAMSQMGAMGLFSEVVGVALGTKQQFGSPGTIAIDHAYKLGSAIASGNGRNIASTTLDSIPLLSIILPIKAIGEGLKDHKNK